MYIEVWQLLVLIIVAGLWSEVRYVRGRKKAFEDCTRDVDVMIEKSINKAKAKYLIILAGHIMNGLITSGLLEKKDDGVFIGKDDHVFDVYAAIQQLDEAEAAK